MLLDDVNQDDIFFVQYYGINIFLRVIDVFSDNTVEVVEIAKEHFKNDDPKLADYWAKHAHIERSETGYIEHPTWNFKRTNKKDRLLYQTVNRVPYFKDEKTGNINIVIPIYKNSLAYKKACVLNKDNPEKVKTYCFAHRIWSYVNSSKEDYQKILFTFLKYYHVGRKEIEKYENIDKDIFS